MTKAEKEQKKKREVASKLSRPRPVELPSGAWRCQIMVKGQRIDVIDEDPAVAHAKALAIKEGVIEQDKEGTNLTLGAAMDRYIESKDSVLSPSTIAGYKRIRSNAFTELMGRSVSSLTQEDIQRAVNKMAKDKSPKSVANAHGLLSATLAVHRPNMMLRTTLPQKQKHEAAIPSDDDIEKILKACKGTDMELPILLAIWLGLRVSEIRGITWGAINGDTLHIKQAIVDGEKGSVVKGTKTYSGNRKIKVPKYIVELIDTQSKKGEYIVPLTRRTIYTRFSTMCKENGIPHYRFHDLRHANASVMLALGVPDKYAMERMGHATNNMLKTVYQHTMKSKQDEVAGVVNKYFENKLHTKLHTQKK